MADTPQGPGWWQASDGKYYPPHLHPYWNTTRPPPPTVAVDVTPHDDLPVEGRRRWWRRHPVAVTVGAVAVVASIGALSSRPATDTGDPVVGPETLVDVLGQTDEPPGSTTSAVPASTAASTSTPTSTATATAVTMPTLPSDNPAAPTITALAELIAEPDEERPPYDRDAFLERSDLDGDCMDSRHETLLEEAHEGDAVLSGNSCAVVAGTWFDPFTDQWFLDPADLQLDHVVSLSDAWTSGAWSWSDEQRRQLSNAAANLNAIAGSENQRKANHGPAQYEPSNPAQRCSYLAQYAFVKALMGLTIAVVTLRAAIRLAVSSRFLWSSTVSSNCMLVASSSSSAWHAGSPGR